MAKLQGVRSIESSQGGLPGCDTYISLPTLIIACTAPADDIALGHAKKVEGQSGRKQFNPRVLCLEQALERDDPRGGFHQIQLCEFPRIWGLRSASAGFFQTIEEDVDGDNQGR